MADLLRMDSNIHNYDLLIHVSKLIIILRLHSYQLTSSQGKISLGFCQMALQRPVVWRELIKLLAKTEENIIFLLTSEPLLLELKENVWIFEFDENSEIQCNWQED